MQIMTTLYDKLGEKNLIQLINLFYDIVFADKRINHLFKNDKEDIKKKQTMFLTQFLGGPPLYSNVYGHPMMRKKHLPHAIDKNAAHAWLDDMHKTIQQLNIDDNLKEELFGRFPPVANHMVNC